MQGRLQKEEKRAAVLLWACSPPFHTLCCILFAKAALRDARSLVRVTHGNFWGRSEHFPGVFTPY